MKYASYIVTGVDRDGRRFRKEYASAMYAFGINLWNGSVWGLLESGKRKLLKRVTN